MLFFCIRKLEPFKFVTVLSEATTLSEYSDDAKSYVGAKINTVERPISGGTDKGSATEMVDLGSIPRRAKPA